MSKIDAAVIIGAVMIALSIGVAIAGLVMLHPSWLIAGTTFAIVFTFAFEALLCVICDKET